MSTKRRRRYWIHPLVRERLFKGVFVTMYTFLREDEHKFSNYFRMSSKAFDELATKLKASIKSNGTVMRLAIAPIELLALTLRNSGVFINLTKWSSSGRCRLQAGPLLTLGQAASFEVDERSSLAVEVSAAVCADSSASSSSTLVSVSPGCAFFKRNDSWRA
ncbi:hypothetical protein PR048_012264 [Dryococelus australis]|uniref:Uncharacterized protein n=1 Tax=Dryococelus australis TaxID=614101 RepID=A0ABQ9HQ62_9NEOP|nr:hypothetical protein PR048_012264 [Dryococelus australis]